MQTVSAEIDKDGTVRLLKAVHLNSTRPALVTIFDESDPVLEAALLSEAALAEDWSRPEEEAAWSHLQQAR